MKWNKLLERQIKKHLPAELLNHEGLRSFLNTVNESYNGYERDSHLVENAFKLSEEEFIAVNKQLAEELALKKVSIAQLKEAISAFSEEGWSLDSDHLLDVVGFLTLQIGRRKEAEARLSTTANRFSTLISNLPMGILVEDEQRTIGLANRFFCNMFGIKEPPAGLSGTDGTILEEAYKHIFADPEAFTRHTKSLIEKKEWRVNDEIMLADGRCWEMDYVPIFMNHVYKGHMWNYRDITDRKQAEQAIRMKEEKYRNIIENMNLGLLELDTGECIQYANHSFCEMSGYALEELYGQRPGALFAALADHELVETKNELRKKGISDAYEIAVHNKSGAQKWWLVSGAPRYDDSGQIVGSIGIHLDITEQKELEFKLNDVSEAAGQSARAKEAFLANMSHEIRTPLNAIMGMSRQLEKSFLDDKQRFFLNTINTATDHLLIVINDILDISKIEAGKLNLEHIGFNLEEVTRHACRVMQPRADEKGLQLNCDIDAGIAPVLLGDPHRLNQVLLNLMSNGIKFTETGAVEVRCQLKEQRPGTQVLDIIVKDTGIGMDQEFLAKLFEKFTQEDRTTARKYGGTGLGMSISRQLVELMSGQIAVESAKGNGTTILLNIPFETGTPADLPGKRHSVADTRLLTGKNVLLVEDNEMNRLVVTTILEGYGVVLAEAVNGADAIARLKQQPFDLVLMDVQMPVMSGLEATTIIRNELKLNIPIIALTANAIKGESQRCLAAGMNDFVSKPFEEEELLGKITEQLDGRNNFGKNAYHSNGRQEAGVPPLFSLAKIEKIGNGDDSFTKKIISLFLQMMPASVATMQDAAATGNWELIRKTAHKIKPTIESMDIFSLFPVIQALEHIPEENIAREQVISEISKLETVLHHVTVQLERR